MTWLLSCHLSDICTQINVVSNVVEAFFEAWAGAELPRHGQPPGQMENDV